MSSRCRGMELIVMKWSRRRTKNVRPIALAIKPVAFWKSWTKGLPGGDAIASEISPRQRRYVMRPKLIGMLRKFQLETMLLATTNPASGVSSADLTSRQMLSSIRRSFKHMRSGIRAQSVLVICYLSAWILQAADRIQGI